MEAEEIDLGVKGKSERKNVNLKFFPAHKIACGLKHCVAVNDSGGFFSWGSNDFGQLGASTSFQNPNLKNGPQERDSVKFLPGRVSQVACGTFHTMAIIINNSEQNEAGTLYAWGMNNDSRLGVQSKEQGQNTDDLKELEPRMVSFSTAEKIKRVYCGPDYSAAITENGFLYTWGNGCYGNLGHNGTDNKIFPTLVDAFREKYVVMAACGAKHMLALTNDKQVYSWGNGNNGRLGHGDSKGCIVPKPIESFINKEINFINCGEAHSAAITVLGDLLTWGHGSYFRLGHGDDSDVFIPKEVEVLKKRRILSIACGIFHNVCVTVNGETFAWGSPQYGKLGITDLNDSTTVTTPRLINRLEGIKITQVAVGKYHSIAISQNGEVFSWGHHGDIRLGYKTKGSEPFPKRIAGLEGITGGGRVIEKASEAADNRKLGKIVQANAWMVSQIACGSQHTIALTIGGQIWVWGEGEHGALGLGEKDKKDLKEPSLLLRTNITKVIHISCGALHTMAITSNGEVFTWGHGESGQLGTGGTAIEWAPRLVESLQGKRITQGACGENFTAVLSDQGDVYTWGDAEVGKLGLGPNTSTQYYPRQIKDFVPIVKISAGMAHMAAISSQGLIFTWGSGFYGRLGHKETENRYSPKQVLTNSAVFKDISAGSYHTVAIEQNGYLYIWGRAKMVCSYENVLEPTKIVELKNRSFKAVEAGDGHTIALSVDGEVFAWGSNKYGKLGLDSINEQYEIQPMKITELPVNVTSIATGYNHCSAITDNGEVYTWGAGGSGRLGHGNVEPLRIPNLINQKWAAMKNDDDDDDDNTISDYLLTQIMNGGTLNSFREIMLLLQQEEEESLDDKLKIKEQEISVKLEKMEDFIRKLKDNDQQMKKFENEIQKVVLQRVFQLKIPNSLIFENRIDRLISANISIHEKIVWILQVQPCYLSSLINTIFKQKPAELERVMLAINYIFQNINYGQDSGQKRTRKIITKRDQLLYLNLCKRIIKEEVEQASTFAELFGHTTPSTLFLKTFFRRELGSTIADKMLSDSLKLLEMETYRSDMFSIDPIEIANKERMTNIGNRTKEVLMNDKKIKTIIIKNSENLVKYGKKLIDNIIESSPSMPFPIKSAIKHAKKCIEKRYWTENESRDNMKKEFQELIIKKLISLLFSNLIVPIIRAPEGEGLLSNVSDVLSGNLLNMASFIDKVAARENLMGGELMRELNSFIRFQWDSLSIVIKSFLRIDDQSKVELSLASYESHYILEDPVISIPSDDYLYLILQMMILKERIQLRAENDPLFDMIKKLGNLSSAKILTENNFKFNLRIPVRFLLSYEGEVVNCQKCGSPVPLYLSVEKKKDASEMLTDFQYVEKKTVLKKFMHSSKDVAIDALNNLCRKVKRFNVNSLDDLKVKLQELHHDFLTKLNPPNYELASYMKYTEKMVTELINGNLTLEMILKEMSLQFRRRIKHRDYLSSMKKGIEQIFNSQIYFKEEMTTKEKDLENYLFNIKQFNMQFKFPIQEKSKIKLLQIKTDLTKKREKIRFDRFPAEIKHEITGTIKFQILLDKKIIDSFLVQYQKNIIKNLHFNYSNFSNEGWVFQVIYRLVGADDSLIGQFKISNQEYNDMKRTSNKESKYTVEGLGIVFNTFELLRFLSSKIQTNLF